MTQPSGPESYREFRSHWIPRTRGGKCMLLFFGLGFLMAEWPLLHLANRIQPLVLGLPFLFVWLSAVYLALMLGLLCALVKRL